MSGLPATCVSRPGSTAARARGRGWQHQPSVLVVHEGVTLFCRCHRGREEELLRCRKKEEVTATVVLPGRGCGYWRSWDEAVKHGAGGRFHHLHQGFASEEEAQRLISVYRTHSVPEFSNKLISE